MENLTSDDPQARMLAIAEIFQKIQTNPASMVPELPKLIAALKAMSDPTTAQSLAGALYSIFQYVPGSNVPYAAQLFEIFEEMVNKDITVWGTVLQMMVGINVSCMMADPTIAMKSFPILLRLSEVNHPINAQIPGYLGMINQAAPAVLLSFVDNLFDRVLQGDTEAAPLLKRINALIPYYLQTNMQHKVVLLTSNPDEAIQQLAAELAAPATQQPTYASMFGAATQQPTATTQETTP
ncbi:MAG: hypothetical protein ACXADX_20130, partial [Candidatus Hodarchaeales archaeon]